MINPFHLICFIKKNFHRLYPRDSKFKVSDIPDLFGKVVLITGDDGIGYQTAKVLLQHNARVYIACRSETKANEMIAKLKDECDGQMALYHPLDLADLSAIKASAQSFLRKEPKLHILFNNAGIMEPPKNELTKDGYDLTLGVNLLGAFYLTTQLLPALLAVGESTPGESARVVNTSSLFSDWIDRIDYTTFRDGPVREMIPTALIYAYSKFGIILFSNELARRYGDKGILSTAVDHGYLRPEVYISQHTRRGIKHSIRTSVHLYMAEMGALTLLYAGGCLADPNDLNGKYVIPRTRVGPANPASDNQKLWEELWAFLEEQVRDVV